MVEKFARARSSQRLPIGTSSFFLGILLSGLANSRGAWADVKLPAVLSSHMVLQREMAVPIWGTADPDEKITVQFRNQTKSIVADPTGKWMGKLDALQAGGPDTLTITAHNTLLLQDVLVGEVWLGSGQSNMALPVSQFALHDEVLAKDAAATYPRLRLLRRGETEWREASPENNAQFSALLFGFGTRLQKALDVPVGLMVGAVGGTPSGYWVSQKAFDEDEAVRKSIAEYRPRYESQLKKAEDEQAAWKQTPAAAEPNAKSPVRFPSYKPGEGLLPIGNLYEKHIRPLLPFAIRGVLWDQGENGTGVGGVDQYTLMGALIRGWRREWDEGDFPFIYVAKPSGSGTALDLTDPITNKAEPLAPLPPKVGDDVGHRDEYLRIKNYPHTAMVTASDLGGGTHPTNKSGYSARAARVALGFVYGTPVEYYGPAYESQQVEGNQIRIRFSHVGKGLTVPMGQSLKGFAVAGEDKNWVWADAKIDGESVVVSSSAVAKPVAVCYAWSVRIAWANLFNKDGLPALPFATDK